MTLDLRGFVRAVGRRWPGIVVFALLGIGGAVTVTQLATPLYEARSQLFVSARVAEDATELQQGGTFTQARVQSYAEIATSRQVTAAVVTKLDLPMSPRELAERVTAEAPLNTVLINLTVRDTEARRAADIADAVAGRFAEVVEGLETPDGEDASPVKLGVTQDAAPPAAPVAPKPALNYAAGLFAGLLAGVGYALLREQLDTTLKTPESLAAVTGLTVLGGIPYDRLAPDAPLVTDPGSYSERAEAYRLVRTNLQFAFIDKRPRVMVVTSALAGEGKTSASVSLAHSLAEAGLSTCLVDADLRRPRVAGALGLIQDAGLTSVLIGQTTASEVLQQAAGGRLSVLAAGQIPPNPAELLASERMRTVLRDLSDAFDVVVVDCAPLLPVADTAGLAPHADGAVLVVRAGRTPGDRVRAAAESLAAVGAPVLGAVLNRVVLPKSYGYGYGYAPRESHVPRRGILARQRRGSDKSQKDGEQKAVAP